MKRFGPSHAVIGQSCGTIGGLHLRAGEAAEAQFYTWQVSDQKATEMLKSLGVPPTTVKTIEGILIRHAARGQSGR